MTDPNNLDNNSRVLPTITQDFSVPGILQRVTYDYGGIMQIIQEAIDAETMNFYRQQSDIKQLLYTVNIETSEDGNTSTSLFDHSSNETKQIVTGEFIPMDFYLDI